MCSLHVMWWEPSRSAASATATTAPKGAVSSHELCTRGFNVRTGVISPSFTTARRSEEPSLFLRVVGGLEGGGREGADDLSVDGVAIQRDADDGVECARHEDEGTE